MAKKLRFIIEIDEKGTAIIKELGGDFKKLEGTAAKTGGTLRTLRSHWLALSAAMAATAYATIRIGKSFVQAAGEAEMFQTQLLGVSSSSEEALKAYKQMLDFAARTPHMTQDVVSAFIMLRSVGMNPTVESMKTLGDVAFLFNRNIQDVGSGLISFEKEVLRRLGIEIDRTGQKVKIMSGSMILETENAAAAIRAGLLQVWEARFGGAMEKAESTWKGAVALFKSAVWEMQKSFGEILLPGLKLIIQWITNVIFRIRDWAETHQKAVQDIIKEGLIKIILHLKKVALAIWAVTEAWYGWKELLALLRMRIAEMFAELTREVGGLLEILGKLTGADIFATAAKELKQFQSIWKGVATDMEKDLLDVVERQQTMRQLFRDIRQGITSLGKEVDIAWPKLTGLMEGMAGGTVVKRGGPPKPEIPEIPYRWVTYSAEITNAMAAEFDMAIQLFDLEKDRHAFRMTAFDETIEKLKELSEAHNIVQATLGELINLEEIYLGLRGAVKDSIVAAILAYDSFGVAIRKAMSQILASMAAEYAVRALESLAWGFYNLGRFPPNPAAAAAAFKSAAMFGAAAAAAGIAARVVAPAPTGAERTGYAEATGGAIGGLAREAEPQSYPQQIHIHIEGDVVNYHDWFENTFLPTLKEYANRDVVIVTEFGK